MPRCRNQMSPNPDPILHAAEPGIRPRISLDVPVVIAAGGALGAVGRYGLTVVMPHNQGGFPWATFWTNVAGCLLIGVVMVMLTEGAGRPHRLVRPFVGVGILGGLTTFSTYTVDINRLVAAGTPGTALVYMFATLAAALVAVQVGMVMTRWATRARRTGKDTET